MSDQYVAKCGCTISTKTPDAEFIRICEYHYKPNKSGEEWAMFLNELCKEAQLNHKDSTGSV